MRILFVAMSDSIHTARWINQISDQDWDVHLFPSIDNGVVHPDMRNVTVYHSVYRGPRKRAAGVKCHGIPVPFGYEPAAVLGRRIIKKFIPQYRVIQFRQLIDKIKPDIIHSLEIQNAGYLTMEARKKPRGEFPPWIVTNWGSDIFLFGRLAEHESKIREVLAASDYYSCECHRDVGLAKEYSFTGQVLPVFPNTGGFNLEKVPSLRRPGKVSDRRVILLKGYQHWAGRALVGLRALERCADLLNGYEVAIYSATSEVLISAELFTKSTGVPIKIIPLGSSHEDILKLHGQARISIGLSISDAISTSLLEAIVMGSFPIQSWTSCGNEWIEDGKTGILTSPEDPDIVEKAIRRALFDDDLVNIAAAENWKTAVNRLDQLRLKVKTIHLYESILKK